MTPSCSIAIHLNCTGNHSFRHWASGTRQTGESYRLEYRNQTQMHFELVGETACDYLAADFDRQPNWKRVEP